MRGWRLKLNCRSLVPQVIMVTGCRVTSFNAVDQLILKIAYAYAWDSAWGEWSVVASPFKSLLP